MDRLLSAEITGDLFSRPVQGVAVLFSWKINFANNKGKQYCAIGDDATKLQMIDVLRTSWLRHVCRV